MTTSPKLDAVAVSGIRSFTPIALADGGEVTVRMPDEGDLMEVFLSEGVSVPESEDGAWDRPLECDAFDGAALFLDVPVQAVRALVTAHGGELHACGPGA
ncbi:hypothetical protein [Streptomyces sp. NPDC050145]|uniref:hypothetical protein n=1 Tax=Streptomyces sp. NPDC050145 TaxID=3365602 RepID=UPI0037A758F6